LELQVHLPLLAGSYEILELSPIRYLCAGEPFVGEYTSKFPFRVIPDLCLIHDLLFPHTGRLFLRWCGHPAVSGHAELRLFGNGLFFPPLPQDLPHFQCSCHVCHFPHTSHHPATLLAAMSASLALSPASSTDTFPAASPDHSFSQGRSGASANSRCVTSMHSCMNAT